jgi:hypothetical protein
MNLNYRGANSQEGDGVPRGLSATHRGLSFWISVVQGRQAVRQESHRLLATVRAVQSFIENVMRDWAARQGS